MKSLIEEYNKMLSEYNDDIKTAQNMRMFDLILNKDFGRRISLLDEAGAGASRLLNLFKSGNPFIQITAFKGCKKSRKENLRNNAELLKDLRSKGLGTTNVIGNDYCEWNEDKTPVESTLVEEPGFFASFSLKNKMSQIKTPEELKDFGVELCKKYDQWGFLFGDEKTVYSISPDGKAERKFKRMEFNRDKMDWMWSEIKGHKYTFRESVYPDGALQGQIWIDVFRD